MAKKFMHVCFGILALVVAFHLGAQYGQAGYIDHSTTGIVALINDYAVLLDNGEAWWYVDDASGWQPFWSTSITVPVADAKFIGRLCYVDHNNQFWLREGQWVNKGAPPGLVSTQSTTWGQIKAEFGE